MTPSPSLISAPLSRLAVAASLLLLIPGSACLPDRVDALEADLQDQQALIDELESRLAAADERIAEADALLAGMEARAEELHLKNPPGADLVGCATEAWVDMQGYARVADLEPYALQSWVDDAIDANTCPTVADAGPDQTVASSDSTCSQDAYGNWTCSSCVVDVPLEVQGAASSGGLGYTWAVLSGPGVLGRSSGPDPVLTVTVPATEPGVTITEAAEVEVTATDCLGGSAVDAILVTVECTPPTP